VLILRVAVPGGGDYQCHKNDVLHRVDVAAYALLR
jgi:hypothetical protein